MTTLLLMAKSHYEAQAFKLNIPRMGVKWAEWDELSPTTIASKVAQMRAAVEALREPSDGMLMSGKSFEFLPGEHVFDEIDCPGREDVEAWAKVGIDSTAPGFHTSYEWPEWCNAVLTGAWMGMIDQVLKETEG